MTRTLVPKDLKLTNDEIKKQLDDAKKKGNVKKLNVSQFDAESAGGFSKPSEEETKKILTSKFRERISMQEELRRLEIAQQFRWVESEELQRLYGKLEEGLKKKSESMSEEDYCSMQGYLPKWYGLPMPKKVLIMEINTKIHLWKSIMQQRNHYYTGLKNLGFGVEELNQILSDGKLITDHDKMKQMEEDFNAKKLEKDDIDAV